MKKILILGNNDQGLYKFRRELIQELLKNYEVIISTPYGEYIPLLEKMGCTFLELEYDRSGKNVLKEINLIRKFSDIIQKSKCDIVLLYTIKPTLYAGLMCIWKKIPFLVNITGIGPALTSSSMLRKICFAFYRIVLKRADMVFFQNKENMELFRQMKTVGENYKLIPGSGVNLQEYDYWDYRNSEKINILYVGRITKIKGMDELLKAIEILKQQEPDFSFEFVGACDEQYKEKIEIMHNNQQIIYHGLCTSAKEYMINTQALIMPSYGEGMSNVLLEASAIGRPVLATNVSGCKEIIEDGKNGFLFEPHSADEIVSALQKLKEKTFEERMQMGRMAREYVQKNFSREIVVKEYINQINKICKE